MVTLPVDASKNTAIARRLYRSGATDDVTTIVTRGLPVKATPFPGLNCAPQYGNHRSVDEHLSAFWKNSPKTKNSRIA